MDSNEALQTCLAWVLELALKLKSGIGQPCLRATLELSLWDIRHSRRAFYDEIVFQPFTSVVIVLDGEFETPADPPAAGAGIVAFAVQEYRESGLDVHLYDDSDVALNGSGAPYDEVVSAIQERGVTNVAIMGYSHGGGSTYYLSWRLDQNTIQGSGVTDITNPFTVAFTGSLTRLRTSLPAMIVLKTAGRSYLYSIASSTRRTGICSPS
jgi:hypothetical protein